MALRRRHKRTEQSKIDATPPWEIRHRDEPEPTSGPYDELDAPDDGLTRVDLGALRVPVRPGMEMRLDMNEAQQVIGVTLVNRDGQMQLGAFAAPRNEGIWDDVRAEIRQSLAGQQGSAKDRTGGPSGPVPRRGRAEVVRAGDAARRGRCRAVQGQGVRGRVPQYGGRPGREPLPV